MASRRKARKNRPPLSSRVSTPDLSQQLDAVVEELVTFAQNPDSPAVVDPRAVSAPPAVTVRRDDDEVREEERQEQEFTKADKKLIDAVDKLTKSMDLSNKLQKEKGIGGFVKGKIKSVKDFFTLPGIAGAIAGKAGFSRDDGSLVGAALESLNQRREKKLERVDYARKFSTLTEEGRNLKERGIVEGGTRFDELKGLEPDLQRLEAKEKEARDVGGSLSDNDAKELEGYRKRHKELTTFEKLPEPDSSLAVPVREEPTAARTPMVPLLPGVAEGMMQGIAEASPEEREALRNADPEYLREMFRGALEGLIEVEDEQLAELQRIAQALHVSEEDRLEASATQEALPVREEQEREEQKSFLSKIFENISGGFLKLFGAAKASILKIVGGLSAGIMAVVKLVSGALIATVTKLISLMSAAVPGGAAKLAGGVKALAGGGAKAIAALASAPVALGALVVGGVAYAGYRTVKEKEELESLRERADEAIRLKDTSLLTKEEWIRYQTLSSSIEGDSMDPEGSLVTNAEKAPEKATPRREVLNQEMKTKEAALDATKKPDQPSVVNNTPTTIINNNNVKNEKTGGRAPVRNVDPTYNRRLDAMFA
jgi:hypothetical protein